jgi:hypothetical protein
VSTIHRRLSIDIDSSLQRIHADVARTGKERGSNNTSAESRARESVVEVGLKIVDVAVNIISCLPGSTSKSLGRAISAGGVCAEVPQNWFRLFDEHAKIGSTMKQKAEYTC